MLTALMEQNWGDLNINRFIQVEQKLQIIS